MTPGGAQATAGTGSARPFAGWREFGRAAATRWSTVARTSAPKAPDVERYGRLVAPGRAVLELGCGAGDLLAALRPARGVGVDVCDAMIDLARARHPELELAVEDAHALAVEGAFDVIILDRGLVEELWDVQAVLEGLHARAHRDTRILVDTPSLGALTRRALARGLGRDDARSWLAPADVEHLLALAGFEVIGRSEGITVGVPRPPSVEAAAPSVSIVIPARNEAGNIDAIFERTPSLGEWTELVFVEGHSTDDTWGAIRRAIARHPERPSQAMKQRGAGKGDAVRLGFSAARGDVLMILDADLTVPPEDLTRFYEALVRGQGDLVNGVRLVYPMEDGAMRPLNLAGNRLFGHLVGLVAGQRLGDALCGTKVLWRRDLEPTRPFRAELEGLDPFGDFELLLGFAKANKRIVDLPIRYRSRTYGTTNIHRFRHGAELLALTALAAWRTRTR